ncbi:MAG: hypothetical protein H7288_14015, partial [Kineosporiaceae bacterium]|nr:hypothetical protein [Aeromicrobium sp.]
ATERLAEAQTLASEGDARNDDLVVQSLSDFADTASSGSQSLFSDYTSGGDNTSIDKVNSFATASSAILSNLSGNISPNTSVAYKTAASTVTELASQASTLCSACSKAELTSLAQSAVSFGKAAGSKRTGAEPTVAKKGQKPTSATNGTGTPTFAQPKLPSVQLPTVPAVPTVPTATTNTGDPTKPLVGELVGGDDDNGLVVPGLLGGLLGN